MGDLLSDDDAPPVRAEPDRARLIEQLEHSLARGRQLLALTRSLSGALSVEAVADAVTANARQALGTLFAGIALVEESGRTLRYVSMAPLPAATAAVWGRIPLDRPAPVSDAARRVRPFFHEDVAQAVADFPDLGPHLATAGAAAIAHLPLVSGGGRVLGTLALSWSVPRPMPDEDRDFLVTLAGHTAQAIERAQLFERQRSAADTLQRAVLPDVLPDVPGVSLGARFVPASAGVGVGAGVGAGGEVGGDWYDAFVLPDGRLGVAVGDAAGHGLPAARVMSVLRNALRAYALLGGGPGEVLSLLDRLVARNEPDAFATLAYLELDPATGAGCWAAAGHLPMLRVAADGTADFLPADADPPIGLLGGRARERQLRLAAGETLVLFTDGLVERRDADLDVGLAALRDAVGEGAGTEVAADLVQRLAARLIGGGGHTDDVCVVAVTLTPTAAGGGGGGVGGVEGGAADRVEVALRPVPHAAFEARATAREAVAAWGLADVADTVELVVSELVTNAVTHAGGDVRLTLERLADAVRVHVHDGSRDAPLRRDADPGEEHGRGVHLVDVLAARWGTGPTEGGKCVWAEVGRIAADRTDSLTRRGDRSDPLTSTDQH